MRPHERRSPARNASPPWWPTPRGRAGDAAPLCQARPYPGDGQSRASIRGRSLASSSAESVDLGRATEPAEATDSSSPDWDAVVGRDSATSSASSGTCSVGTCPPGMSSAGAASNCSALGDGLTICPRGDETRDADFQPRQHRGVPTRGRVDVCTGDSV